MKKYLSFSLVLTFIFSLVFNSGSSYAENQTSTGEVFITISSEFDTKNITDEEAIELANTGWQIGEDRLSHTTKASYGEIIVNGKTTPIFEDGTFSVEGSPETIEVEFGDEKQTLQKNENGNYVYIQEIDWDYMMAGMENGEKSAIKNMNEKESNKPMLRAYGKKYKKGDWVHCNRFNGPASDGYHYPKTNPKAYVNFTGSDCFMAIVSPVIADKCALDYTSKPWCNGSGGAAACSKKIGHSTKYHKH